MNGKIYKVVENITKEEILQNCEFKEISDYGDVMTYDDFMRNVEDLSIMDYDGCGALIISDKAVMHTYTWISSRAMYFDDLFIVPFDVLHSLFGDDMKVVWFNK